MPYQFYRQYANFVYVEWFKNGIFNEGMGWQMELVEKRGTYELQLRVFSGLIGWIAAVESAGMMYLGKLGGDNVIID